MVAVSRFSAAQIQSARIRTSIGFILFGLVQGLWLVQIPVVVDRLQLDTQTLSLVVLTAGIGSAIAQPLAGWFVGVAGSRNAMRLFQPVFFAIIPVLILAPTLTYLFVAAFAMGLVGGPLNVSINTQATEVENARGRATMSSFHGWFSIGSVASASTVALIFWLGYAGGEGVIMVTMVAIAISIWLSFGLLPARVAIVGKRPGIRWPAKAVIGLAVLIFFSNAIEGGPPRKPNNAAVATLATPTLGVTPGTRLAAPINTGKAFAAPKPTIRNPNALSNTVGANIARIKPITIITPPTESTARSPNFSTNGPPANRIAAIAKL